MNLSVVIPTWNGLNFLPACLAALLPQLPPESEVILVDNGSHDGTAAWAADQPVRLVALPENRGFAGGVNAGIQVATGAYILLLNNDAFIEPGCVAALCATIDANPLVGAVAGVLLFDHRPDTVASAGVVLRRDGVAFDLWPGLPVAELPTEPVAVLGASGGLALYRRTMLEDIGLFDETFFAYLEDVDLALRAQLRGWQTVLAPAARARHIYSATGGHGSPFKQRLLAMNRIRVLVRCLPAAVLIGCLPRIALYDLAAVLYGLLVRQPAVVQGRIAALSELTALLRQRRAIQQRRVLSARAFGALLEPAPSPMNAFRLQQRLGTLLRR